MKIALYVEGQTEIIFVREFLRKWYDYDANKIGFECLELRNAAPFETAYSMGDKHSERFYTIVNVGCDTRALSKALENASEHRNRGYNKVIVLRDMYSEDYKKFQHDRKVDQLLNTRFIQGALQAINQRGFENYVHCHFAIMEIEAWLLGMGWYLSKHDPLLTQDYILSELEFDLDKDPESIEFHPAGRLKGIYGLAGKNYDKHAHEVNAIMSHIEKRDFEFLLELEKCESFKNFITTLTD